MLRLLWRLQLRSVRGQLASSASACATAEARNRLLSGQVSDKNAELAQMREQAEKAASNYKAVWCPYFSLLHFLGMTGLHIPVISRHPRKG